MVMITLLELKAEITKTQNLLNEVKTTFKWNEFKALKSHKDILQYALTHLEAIGSGSSRLAFQLGNSGKILKVARNNKGFGQNKAEVDVFTNPATKSITTRIFDFDPNFVWIVSEAVRVLTSSKTDRDLFERSTGMNWQQFVNDLWDYDSQSLYDDPSNSYTGSNQFLKNILQVMRSTGLLIGDLERIEHFGKTADGRVVLLDYGFTDEVQNQHYDRYSKKNTVTPIPDDEITNLRQDRVNKIYDQQQKAKKKQLSSKPKTVPDLEPGNSPNSPQSNLPNTAPSRPRKRPPTPTPEV